MQSQPPGHIADQMAHLSLGGGTHSRPGGPPAGPGGPPYQGSFPPQPVGAVSGSGPFPPRPGPSGGPAMTAMNYHQSMNGIHQMDPSGPRQGQQNMNSHHPNTYPSQPGLQPPPHQGTQPSMQPGVPPSRQSGIQSPISSSVHPFPPSGLQSPHQPSVLLPHPGSIQPPQQIGIQNPQISLHAPQQGGMPLPPTQPQHGMGAPLAHTNSLMNGVAAAHPGMGQGPLHPNAGPPPQGVQYAPSQQAGLGYPQQPGMQKGFPPAASPSSMPQSGSYMNGMSTVASRPGIGQGAVPPGPGSLPPPGMAYGQQPGPKGFPPHAPDMYHQGGPQSPMGFAPAGGMYPQQQQQQQQQQRRLDPANMPSPIQVMQEDQQNKGGIFVTNQKGQTPPLVTTEFMCQDQGNASPRYIRATMYNVPITMDTMKQVKVPLGLVISPLAQTAPQELPPPVVSFGEMGPVRCLRCKAYMCPFMQFIDGGRRFHCLFCKATSEVPPDYFQHLDHTGQRVDRYDRPELVLGSYEFVATKEYCRNNTFPKPPALIFLIDVSYNNIKSGMIHLLCARMKELLRSLPVDSGVGAERTNMRVGFITYNSTVHFYNIKSCLAQPQMMVVGDVQDMFMPLLDGFLCDPEESEAVIDSLMEQIPAMFGETRETETVLAPAIQAGMEALKAAECTGKLIVFHSSLPIAEAPGKLKNRDDRKLLATDKEKIILTPQINTYNNLGQECVGVGCSIDLFIFNNSYIDIATIGQVARLTGGEVYKYTYFQADIDGDRLIADLQRNISRPIAFDAVMRVRTSTGVRATDFYGHFYMSNTTDMELASMDCDKAVAIEVKHDDKLTEEDGVYVQVALLYTSCGGQRRLRIHNLALKTCAQMADMFRTCDLDTTINFLSKLACYRLLEHSPKHVKDSLISLCAQTLACYRKNCASPSSAGQLILPETMKLLPLYLNCLLKSDALSGGSDMTVDDRSYVMQAVMTMDVPSSVVFFYPRLIPLHDLDSDSQGSPLPVRCSIENFQDYGVYLLENGIHMFLWIGLAVSVEWIEAVFGVTSVAQIEIERPFIPELDTDLSKKVRNVISLERAKRHRCMRLTIVRQRDKLEMVMKHFLVEDRGLDNSPSYVDFLCQMHKEIRTLLE